MTFCINSGCGKAIVIEFERNGEIHRALRWTSDVELMDSLLEQQSYKDELRQRFQSAGATVVSIAAVEMHTVALM